MNRIAFAAAGCCLLLCMAGCSKNGDSNRLDEREEGAGFLQTDNVNGTWMNSL